MLLLCVVVVCCGCGGGGGSDGAITEMSLSISLHACNPATLALTSSWTEGEKCFKNEAKKPISVRLDLVDERI